MIAVVLPVPSALAGELALSFNGALAAADLHCTLVVIDSDHPDVASKVERLIANVARSHTAIAATLSGIGRFSGVGSDAFHLSVDAPDLQNLNSYVRDELRWAGVPIRQEHGFDPHVTLAYLAKDAAAPLDRFEPQHMRFDAVAVWHGDRRQTYALNALLSAKRGAALQLDALPLPEAPPVELRLFRDGWNETTKGRFLLDADSAALVLRAFAEHGVELAMDFDHGTFAPAGSKRDVPGYIGALEYRPGDGLFATRVRWTDVGLRAISAGRDSQGNPTLPEYRYLSPAIRFDAESRRITAIEPVALVTWPATKNQPPIVMAATGDVPDTEKPKMNPQLLMLLGLAMSATEHDVLSAAMKVAKERDEALTAKAAAGAALDGVKAERDALAKSRDELLAKLEDSERGSLFDQGRREHKLTPALEQLFAKKSPEEIRAFLAAAPVVEALKPGPKQPAESAPMGNAAQLGAVLAKPYEQWSNNERALVREQSPETFRAKREDAIARGAL